MLGQVDFEKDDLVVTFEGLLTRTPFVKQMHALLNLLEETNCAPADIEFASDGERPLPAAVPRAGPAKHAKPAPIPRDIPATD
jgi:pyruvate,water dikinase